MISLRILRQFWKKHPQAEGPLRAWHKAATGSDWSSPHDVKKTFASADQIGDNRMVFDIGGNKYRLVVRFAFSHKRAMIKFVGTHAEYDKIDAETV